MEKQITKRYPVIACCGIDCGLCPRYYTQGESKCPGCLGGNFHQKHPACSIITCCVKKHAFETCAECPEFPCEKLQKWDQADSFVTHRKSLNNLRRIKDGGLAAFVRQQKERILILNQWIDEYDDGRSKSFFCLAAALMEMDDLNEVISRMKAIQADTKDRKQLAKQARIMMEQQAEWKGVELIYRKEKD